MNTEYVLVVHKPSCRAFTLNRGYHFLKEVDICQYHTRMISSHWDGWRPTQLKQQPNWACNLPDCDFEAFWFPEIGRKYHKRDFRRMKRIVIFNYPILCWNKVSSNASVKTILRSKQRILGNLRAKQKALSKVS